MSSGTQSDLPIDADERRLDHEVYLNQDQRRWIRQHIRTVQAMIAAPTPFTFDHLDSGLPITRCKVSKCPVINKEPGTEPAQYRVVDGVRDYTAEYSARDHAFTCCPYPDGFVNRDGDYYCKYCFEDLDEEQVREASL